MNFKNFQPRASEKIWTRCDSCTPLPPGKWELKTKRKNWKNGQIGNWHFTSNWEFKLKVNSTLICLKFYLTHIRIKNDHRFTKRHISVLGSSFFLCFFSVFFFKPNNSIPYCAYIWACSRGIPLIFGVVLPNFVYFYCFGGWKTNQCRKKNIVFVAFLWSVSLWASLNFSAYGFKTKWSFQNTYFCKIGKSCHDQNFFSMSAGWISDHMVGIPPTSIETSQDGWNSNHLQLLNWPFLLT